MQFVMILAILTLLVLVVSAPLRRVAANERAEWQPDADDGSELAELQAARTAKYREIRDAELDHRTGKLSDLDFEAVDSELRAEAIDILRELDRAGGPAEELPSDRI